MFVCQNVLLLIHSYDSYVVVSMSCELISIIRALLIYRCLTRKVLKEIRRGMKVIFIKHDRVYDVYSTYYKRNEKKNKFTR